MMNKKSYAKFIIYGFILMSILSTFLFFYFDNFDFFHLSIEVFELIIATSILVTTLISRRLGKDDVLFFISIGLFLSAVIGFLHAATFAGVDVINNDNQDLTLQLWLVSSFVLCVSFFYATLKINKDLDLQYALLALFTVASLLTILVFLRIFPHAFNGDTGVTLFNRISEFVFAFIYLISIYILRRKKIHLTNYFVFCIVLLFFALSSLIFGIFTHTENYFIFTGHLLHLIGYLTLMVTIYFSEIKNPIDSYFKKADQELAKLIQNANDSERISRDFEELYSNSQMGYQSLDIDGNYIYVNDVLLSFLGYKRKEMIGKNFADFIKEEQKPVFLKNFKKFKARGKINSDFTMIHKSGEEIEIHFFGRIERNLDSSFKRTHCILKNVTNEEMYRTQSLENLEKMNLIMDSVEEAIYGIDINDNCTFVNQSFLNLMGFKQEDVIGENMHKLIHHSYPDGTPYLQEDCPMERAFKQGQKVRLDLEYLWKKNGDKIPVEYYTNPLYKNGNLIGAVVGFKDISERLKYLEEMKLINQKQKLLLDSATDIVFTVDKSMKYIDAYGTGLSLIELNEVDYLSKEFIDVFDEDFWEDRKEKYELAFKGMASEHIWKYRMKDKTVVYQTYISPLYNTYNEIVGAVGVSRDITNLQNKYEELEYMGYHDFLTDLYNRRYFRNILQELDAEKRYPFGIFFMDINGLKTFNDVYGYEMGDQVIKSVADTLKKYFNSNWIIARIGGDEFAAILPNAKKEEIIRKRDAIIEKISEISIMNIRLSVSIGYYIKTDDSVSFEEAEKLAENDMLKHKLFERNSNRNRAIQAIFKTLTDKYEEEKIHSQYVSKLSLSIGKALNMDKDQMQFLGTAAIFHDIGKIAIPDSVLKKPDKLTDEEYETIKTHTEIGYQILNTADQFSDLAKHALHHHESWDGKGYPRGLEGENIPLISRIIGVADAFEAMTSDRVYSKKMSEEEAVKEIVRYSGTQFDPRIARVFVEKVLNKNWNEYL